MAEIIVNGDFRYLLPQLPESSLSTIVTDPPYGRKYGHLTRALLTQSGRILKDGGTVVLLLGHFLLPDIFRWAIDGGLTFTWIGAKFQSSPQARLTGLRLFVGWKPVLLFRKGIFRGPRQFRPDVISVARPDKKIDKWFQGIAFNEWALRFAGVQAGEVALDPMMGSGPLLGAARLRGVHAIGIDYNRRLCEVAAHRLGLPIYGYAEVGHE